MTVLGFGKNMKGELLFPAMDEDAVIGSLRAALATNSSSLGRQTKLATRGFALRDEVVRRVEDLGDARAAGWTFVVAAKDPRRDEIIQLMKPLAEHRGMENPAEPLIFDDQGEDSWGDWIQDYYWGRALEGKKVPKYVLLVGEPDYMPFGFHSLLDAVANVGRIEFDDPSQLEAYVKKIIRLETAAEPVVNPEAVVFATDGGLQDPTYYSRKYMATPLAAHVAKKPGIEVKTLFGADATKTKLKATLQGARPALVYTASHGLGLTGQPMAEQRRYNGAICCQTSGELTLSDLFCADDVPANEPFLEGAVFFQFACFGLATPRMSETRHWLPPKFVPETYAEKDFTSALPKRLLAHPRGPIAYFGHLDAAFMHAFTDATSPDILERWHTRMEPFVTAVDRLLSVDPSALAMQSMNDRFSICNAVLTTTYDRVQRKSLTWTQEVTARFLDTWILRNDAKNYMVFGDPAARLRIPAP